MTMIYGANLSTRVFLVGDTRLSRPKDPKDKNSDYEPVRDNVQKVEPLGNKTPTLVACAGNPKLAQRFLKKLRKEKFAERGIASTSIRTNIYEWAGKQIDEYYSSNDFTQMCLLFAGLDETKKKRIKPDKFKELLIARGNKTSSFNKYLAGAFLKGAGPPAKWPELAATNSMLFALVLEGNTLRVEDADWGDYLVYGAGLKKEKIPIEICADFELATPEENMHTLLNNLTDGLFQSIVLNDLTTVGGKPCSYVSRC